MGFAIFKISGGSHSDLEALEDTGGDLLTGDSCTTISVGTDISAPVTAGACYTLTFDADSFQSDWDIDTTE